MFAVTARANGSRARAGTLVTTHGTLETPVFMPVGTRGTVRTQLRSQLQRLAPSIILANTYHLMLRPGIELFERLGGLHRWMAWPGAILTDSGGFQIFSLAGTVVREDGAEFRDDGGRIVRLSPERSIAMQRAIGSDIMMVLDECIDSTSPHARARDAMERTHRWAVRSLAARGDSPNKLFAIVQGACFEDLRRESAAALVEHPFDGFAIGGLAVGETKAQREDTTELVTGLLPEDRPRYLMGVGTPLDLLEGVHRGVDMFDCILPTAWAQQGIAFTSHGRVDLRRGVYALAEVPLDRACACEACSVHSRSYLHHLVKCKEPLGWQLLAHHNLGFYLGLMREIRASIVDDSFAALHAARRETLGIVDEDNPPVPARRRTKHKKSRAPVARGAFAVHVATQGFASIQHVASGEIMHSVNDPDVEAERVYVGQSSLLAKARADGKPIVVWDVGLGAAHNAMAVVRTHAGSMELVSFERDLDAFRLALANQKHFAHLRHAAPHVLAHAGSYVQDGLRWTLVEGDFLERFASAPRPDVIFYDPFSSKVDTAMWSLATFRALYAHLAGPVELFTYSSSTAVRSSLLAAGFHVARGVGSGPKEETTIALVGMTSPHELLDRRWLERRARSTAKFTADVPVEEHPGLDAVVQAHAQFA